MSARIVFVLIWKPRRQPKTLPIYPSRRPAAPNTVGKLLQATGVNSKWKFEDAGIADDVRV